MPLQLYYYGDISNEFIEKVKKERPDFEFRHIPTNDLCAFDEAIYKSDALLLFPNKKDPLSFTSTFLAEWRVLNKSLQSRPVFLYSKDGDNFSLYLKTFEKYRANLPDEKNPEAKNWFILPTKKTQDFFSVIKDEEELIVKIKALEKIKNTTQTEIFTKQEFDHLKSKFNKSEVFDSYESYCKQNTARKPGIFVPAFAADNTCTEKLAYKIGKSIGEMGFRFINGGPDGGKNGNGPMRYSALGAQESGAEIFSVYSLPIISKYVTSDKMDCFHRSTSILPVVSEGVRKRHMLDESVAVVALPGAIGTIAEIEDAIRLNKPVILIDDKSIHAGKGYWQFYTDYLKSIGLSEKISVIYNSDDLSLQLTTTLSQCAVKIPALDNVIVNKNEAKQIHHLSEAKSKQASRTDEFNRMGIFYNSRQHDVLTFPTYLTKKLSSKIDFDMVQDGNNLFRFLSTPSVLTHIRDEKKDDKVIYRVKEDFIPDNQAFLKDNIPDVIFIPGNNDLTQVEDAAKLLFKLKKDIALSIGKDKAEELISSIPIVISGLGGHGVTPGPIFASSEAAAIGHYLKSFLQYEHHPKNPIFLEEKATNTGQNISFTKPIMQRIEQNAKNKNAHYQGLSVWLIPTPSGGIRQLATIAQQSSPEYKIAKAYILPDLKQIQIKYLQDKQENSSINLFAALRETVNYFGYMLDNDFMSPHASDQYNMRTALLTVIKYYELLTRKSISEKDKLQLADDLVLFSQMKEKAGGIHWLGEGEVKLRDAIKAKFDPIKAYFIKAFSQVERQHMENLRQSGCQPNELFKQQLKTKQFRGFLFHCDVDLPRNLSDATLEKLIQVQTL